MVAVGAGGPGVLVSGGFLDVATTAPAPSVLGGQPITSLVDRVRVGRPDAAGDAGERTDEVVVDRTAGTITLVAADAPPERAELGSTPWLSGVTGGGDLLAAGTVTIDLGALDAALGGPPLDRATTVSVQRTSSLADGSSVVARSVQADLAWFDGGSAPLAAAGAAGPGDGRSWVVPVAVAVGVAALLVALAVLAARARREPRTTPAAVTGGFAPPIDLDERRWARAGAAAPGAAQPDPPAGHDLPAGGVWPAATSRPGEAGQHRDHATSPVDALTALFADVDQLTAEVDRILADDEPGPEPEGSEPR